MNKSTMNEDLERVTYFAETDARNKKVRFGIKKKDRSKHMYVIGKTGMGKSTLLENLAIQDIQNGEGLAFIDPHGKTADLLLEYVPEHRIKDVIYFAPFDLDHPVSFNVLEDVGAEKRHLVVNGLMSAFKRIWVDAFSARMEYILSNIMLALLEYPDSTLMGVNRMLVDKEFRNTVVNNITDPSVRSFWVDEYAKYTDKFAAEAAPAIQNKVGQFVANPLVRNIIGQPKSSFDIREIMDQKKILIINLSKGRVGEANANLLGAMIITKIYLAAMSRADMSETELKQAPEFYLYVDEFQSFANESFADILSEARKYKLALIIAHQYIEQMTEEVRAAVFGNVGTMAVYRVGAYDAAVFEKEFVPQFTAEDLVNLQQYQLYLKLMIDGVTSPPFSAMGMTPIAKAPVTYVKEIIDSSRAQFAKPRADVEDVIRQWHLDKILPGPNAVNSTGGAGGHGAGQSGYGGPSSGPSGGAGRSGQSGQSSGSGMGSGYAGDRGGRGEGRPVDRGSDRGERGGSPQNGSYGAQNGSRTGGSGGYAGNGNGGGNGDRPRSPMRAEERQGDRAGDRPRSFGGPRDQGQQDRAGSGDRPPRQDQPYGTRDGGRDAGRDVSRDARDGGDMERGPRDQRRDGNFSKPEIKTEKPFAKAFQVLQAGDADSGIDDDAGASSAPLGQDVPAIDREKSLRDAVSLNYLKDKKEEDIRARNAAKDAKPQNILALKNALLGILGEQVPQVPAQSPDQMQAQVQSAAQTHAPVHAPAPTTTASHEHAPRAHANHAAHPNPAHDRPAATHPEREHPHAARSHHKEAGAAAHPAQNHAPRSEHKRAADEPEAPAAESAPKQGEVDLDTLTKLLSE